MDCGLVKGTGLLEGGSIPGGVVFEFFAGSSELSAVFVLEWWVLPFPLGLEEEGEGVAAGLLLTLGSQDGGLGGTGLPYMQAICHGIMYTCEDRCFSLGLAMNADPADVTDQRANRPLAALT